MKIFLLIYILTFCRNIASAVESTSQSSLPKKHSICSVCVCDSANKVLNCASNNLFNLFGNEEWTEFNANEKAINKFRFDNNGIKEIPLFPKLNTQTLNLKYNLISKIEKGAFKNLDWLENLDLSFNKLTFISLKPEAFEGKYSPETYEPLKNMKTLRLGNNQLHSLDSDLFEHLPNLEELYLDNNPFTVIDHSSTVAISTIPHLRVLDLSYAELKTLPEHIFHTPRELKELALDGNLFEQLPPAIGYAINLANLSLDENIFKTFDTNNSFPNLPKLEALSISYMHSLQSIGNGAFSNLPGLQHFNCHNNPILATIDIHAFSRPGKEDPTREEWPPIRSLLLHNNGLETISSELIGRWDEVEHIDIRYNSWRCDCDTQWMVETLLPMIKQKSPTLVNNIDCHQPPEMIGKDLHELSEKGVRMRCSDYYGNHPERDGPILVGILIGLLIGIPLAMGIILIYKRGCFGILGYGPGPHDYSRAFYKRTRLQDDLHI